MRFMDFKAAERRSKLIIEIEDFSDEIATNQCDIDENSYTHFLYLKAKLGKYPEIYRGIVDICLFVDCNSFCLLKGFKGDDIKQCLSLLEEKFSKLLIEHDHFGKQNVSRKDQSQTSSIELTTGQLQTLQDNQNFEANPSKLSSNYKAQVYDRHREWKSFPNSNSQTTADFQQLNPTNVEPIVYQPGVNNFLTVWRDFLNVVDNSTVDVTIKRQYIRKILDKDSLAQLEKQNLLTYQLEKNWIKTNLYDKEIAKRDRIESEFRSLAPLVIGSSIDEVNHYIDVILRMVKQLQAINISPYYIQFKIAKEISIKSKDFYFHSLFYQKKNVGQIDSYLSLLKEYYYEKSNENQTF